MLDAVWYKEQNVVNAGHFSKTSINKYLELKKIRGAPMGRPKPELVASYGVHIGHTI